MPCVTAADTYSLDSIADHSETATVGVQPSPPVMFPNGTGRQVTFAPFLEWATATIPESFLSFNFDWNLNRSAVDAWTKLVVEGSGVAYHAAL